MSSPSEVQALQETRELNGASDVFGRPDKNSNDENLQSKDARPDRPDAQNNNCDPSELQSTFENIHDAQSLSTRLTSNNESEAECEYSFLETIFDNVLIKENICQYLSVASMKNLRHSSPHIYSSVTSSRHFLNRTRLCLTPRRIKFNANLVINLSKTPWKNLQIDYTQSAKINFSTLFQSHKEIFKKVFDLKLCLNKPEFKFNFVNVIGLLDVLATFKSLKTLVINAAYCKMPLSSKSPEAANELRQIFENLQQFKIDNVPSWEFCDEVDLYTEDDILEESLSHSSIYPSMKNLRSLEIPIQALCSANAMENNSPLNVFDWGLYKLGSQSMKTIVKLDLNFDGFEEQDIVQFKFPALKELTLRETGFDDHVTFAYKFLVLQPLENLKSLSLIIFEDSSTEMKKKYIDLMTNRCTKVESLYLKTGKIQDVNRWEFLSLFTALKRLTIFVPKHRQCQLRKNDGNEFILNQLGNLDELNLRGMKLKSFCSFLSNGNKLTNLVRLSLLDCPQSLDDDKLHFITENLIKLEILEFSDCDEVTDLGITGVRKGFEKVSNPPLPLSNLKGLKELRMISCENITDYSCQFGIEFLDLRILDLSCRFLLNSQITKPGVQALLEKNPSLSQLLLCGNLKSEVKFDQRILDLKMDRNVQLLFPEVENIRDEDDLDSDSESSNEDDFEDLTDGEDDYEDDFFIGDEGVGEILTDPSDED